MRKGGGDTGRKRKTKRRKEGNEMKDEVTYKRKSDRKVG